MLTQVEVRMGTGESILLPLSYTTNGYVVKDIDGLDPGKISISTGKIAGVRGEQHQSSRREARNIVLKIKFEPDFANTTVKQLRDSLYRFLMPQSMVTLRFYMDDVAFVDIDGMVESFDAPMFTSDPGADISIMCFEPDFRGITKIDVAHQTSSFPNPAIINYDGTIATGIDLVLMVNRPISSFTLVNQHTNDQQRFEFEGTLLASDIVRLITVSGSRSIVRTRAGSTISILYGVSPASSWLQLKPGRNALSITMAGTPISFRTIATPLYGGL